MHRDGLQVQGGASIGGGHTITSVLQFMSGEKVLATLQSARFMAVLGESCTEVPADSIPFLLEK